MRVLKKTSLCLVILALTLPSLSQGQPTIHYNDYKNNTGVTDATTLTISNVNLTGTNRGLAVCVIESTNGAVNVSSVTFNTSENLSFVVESAQGDLETEFWYLPNPTATTADVVVTLSGTGGNTTLMGTAIGLSNVKQAQPTLSGAASCAPCTFETVDLTTTVSDTMLLSCGRHNVFNLTWSHGAGQTELSMFGEVGGSGESMTTSYELKGISGSETLEETGNVSGTIGMVAIGVEPVPQLSRRRIPVVFR